MYKSRTVPLLAAIYLFLVLLHAGSIYAEDKFQKRTPQGNVEQTPSPIETIVVDHSSFTVNPTDIIIAGTTIAPTLPAVTIDHAAISVDNSNNVFVNGSEAVTGTPGPSQTSASYNSSILSKSFGVISPSGPSGSPGLFESPILFPTGSGFRSVSNVSGRPGSALAGSGTATTPNASDSAPTDPGAASPNNRSSETSHFSTQSGLQVPSDSSSGSAPTISPNSSSTPLETGVSPSSTSGATSGSQGDSSLGTGTTTTSSLQIQPGESTPPASATSRNATASTTSLAGSSPAPGSAGRNPGPSATSGSTGASTPSGSSTKTSGSSSTASFDVPNTTQAGGIPITSLPSSGPAVSSQRSVFGGILLGFVSDGRSWVNDITLPAIKTQAINEIENLKGNTENAIKNLGGPFPPTSNTCSSGTSREPSFDPMGVVEGLADDALGLANCVDNILSDISSEIGPIQGPPPPPDVIEPISTLLKVLEKAGEEDIDDDGQSTTNTNSNTKGSTTTSSSPTSESSAMTSASSGHSGSSQSTSQTSSAVSGCPSFVYPDDGLEEWEGPSLDGNIDKRAFGIRGRWYRRPLKTSDGNGQTEEIMDRRHQLMKREKAAAISSINGCVFPNGQQGVQPGYSGLRAFISLYYQPKVNQGRNGVVYDAVPKWYVRKHDCDDDNGFAWEKTLDESPAGIPKESRQSIDHVYEKQLINVFLKTVINTGTSSFTCEDMNKVFFDGCGGTSLMQRIFDQLPGMQFSDQVKNDHHLYQNTNPGFAGLEQSINGVKGYMFDRGLDPPGDYFQRGRINKGTQMQIQTVEDFIMLFGILREPEFSKMFDITNDRIYKAYQTVDGRIASQNIQKSDGSGPIEAKFAVTYKTWLTQYLTDIAGPAWKWCSGTVNSIETSLNGKTDDVAVVQIKALNKIKANSGFTKDMFTINFSLSWSIETLSKRDLTGRQASPSNSTDAACANTPSGTDMPPWSPHVGSASGSTSRSTVLGTGTSNSMPLDSGVTVPVPSFTPSTVLPTATFATATPLAFSCTFNANAVDSEFPCSCSDGRTYCTNNGQCDWTTRPEAENCCVDCM